MCARSSSVWPSTVILTGAEKFRSSDGTGLAWTSSNTNSCSACSTLSTVDVPKLALEPCAADHQVEDRDDTELSMRLST